MIISEGRSRKDIRWRQKDMDWPGLCLRLGQLVRTRETVREYKSMSKDDKDTCKDIGGFVGGAIEGGRRLADNVKFRTLVTLDADNAYPGIYEDYAALYDDACCCYSTHSHTEDKPRLRFVLPLDRRVTPDEYGAISRKVAERIGIDCMDPTTYEINRLMYWPSCSSDGVVEYHVKDGPFLCADSILAEYGIGDAWRDTTLWPIGKQETEVRLREQRKQGDPTQKPGMVGLFCRTYDIPSAIDTFLSEEYDESGAGRYTYKKGSTSCGAVLYGDGAFLYSNHATDPCSGMLCNAFDLVRVHRFGAMDAGQENQEVTRRPSYKAMCDLAAQDAAVKRQSEQERQDMLSDIDASDAATDGVEDTSWAEQIVCNPKTGLPEPTTRNALLYMRNDPRLRGTFGYNEMRARVVRLKPLPWRRSTIEDPMNGDSWDDTDDAGLREYMETCCHIDSRNKVQDAFTIVANENSFHPIREYLNSLTWDGVPRADTVFVDYLKAVDKHCVRSATRKWLCAAVARVYHPGHYFRHILVLSGEQGVGKSRVAKALAKYWFSDSLKTMDGSKESYERLFGAWIVELAEMSAAKRSEQEEIKNFISKTEDTFRRAYGRNVETFKRGCVFCASTNDREFLRDMSGDSRYWPIEVNGASLEKLDTLTDEVVDQIWAEVVYLWKNGESLRLSKEDEEEMRHIQLKFHEADERQGLIEDYLNRKLPDNWNTYSIDDRRSFIQGATLLPTEKCTKTRNTVCISEIRCEFYGEQKANRRGYDAGSRDIRQVMNFMPGWKKADRTDRFGEYGQQSYYYRVGSPADPYANA